MLCKKFNVTGRVQGVWFRQSTKNTAQSLSLTGWVSNRQDGSVELIACGSEEVITELETWLWQGPPAAEVESVVSKTITPESFTGFEII